MPCSLRFVLRTNCVCISESHLNRKCAVKMGHPRFLYSFERQRQRQKQIPYRE